MIIFLINVFALELIQFHPEYQNIKSRSQLRDSEGLLFRCFPNSTSKSMFYTQSMYHVYQYKENDKTIASIYLNKETYYSNRDYSSLLTDPTPKTVLEIYSLSIDDSSREKGLALNLIIESINSMIELYSLPKNTTIGLHLNPLDEMMYVSLYFYISIGFAKGSLVKYGPSDYIFKGEKIKSLDHPFKILMKIIKNEENGKYLALFANANKIKKFNFDKNKFLKISKFIQKIMFKDTEEEEL